MSPRGLAVAAIAVSGFASAFAIPVTILQRVPSSAAASAPAVSSYVAVPSASAAPVDGGSVSAAPSVQVSAPPPPIASQPPAPTSTTPTTTATTTTTDAPAATWSIVVDVGSSQFNIGDADPSGFEDIWKQACGAQGCDGGSPQPFSYNGIDGGFESAMEGAFTLTGNVDNNQGWTDSLLDAINAAFQQTKQCSTSAAEQCASKKRESAPIALGCDNVQLEQCTMVNYIQATMYDEDSNQKAQVTLNAASEPDSDFPCDTFLGLINGAATALDVAPPVAGALAIIQVFCDIFSG